MVQLMMEISDSTLTLTELANKDKNLFKDIPQNMLIFNSHQQEYYNWHFGSDNLRGKGLTFSVKQNNGRIVDVGNLIEITDGKKSWVMSVPMV